MTAAIKAPLKGYKLWLLLPALQVVLLFVLGHGMPRQDWIISGSFAGITAFASWQLFRDVQPFSLNKVWWLFGAVFLGIAPSVQAVLHRSPWHDGDIDPATLLKANLLILGCFALYTAVHYGCSRLSARGPYAIAPPSAPSSAYVHRFRRLAPLLIIVCAGLLLLLYGWKALFLRGYYEAASTRYSTMVQLLLDKGIRGIMLYLSLTAIYLHRRRMLGTPYCVLILSLVFLTNFPLAIPRYMALTIYAAWLLMWTAGRLRKPQLFSWLMLGALLLAAPLAGVTRYAGTDMEARLAHPLAVFEKAYLVTDYDAYSSLCRTIKFTDSAGSTNGRQLAGVLLFFVPRALWPEKPVGSGAYLFTRLNFDFKNVSCTYLAEGYINFGLPGALIFTVMLALLIAGFDSWYQNHERHFDYRCVAYLVLTGMMLFILRGDLLSSYAYTVGLLISGWLVHRAMMAGAK